MKLQVNGDDLTVNEGITVAQLLSKLEISAKRLAVERNLEIVPKSQHNDTVLKAGDKVEIVHAIGGG